MMEMDIFILMEVSMNIGDMMIITALTGIIHLSTIIQAQTPKLHYNGSTVLNLMVMEF